MQQACGAFLSDSSAQAAGQRDPFGGLRSVRALRSASGADHMFGRMQRDRGLLLTRRFQAACRCRSVWRSGPVLQLMRSLLNGSVSIGVGAGLHDRPAQRSRRSGVLVGMGLFAAGGVDALAAGYLLTLALLDALHPAH